MPEASIEAKDAAAKEAADRIRDGLRAATGHVHARSHAQLRDVYLAQDLLLSEPVQACRFSCLWPCALIAV